MTRPLNTSTAGKRSFELTMDDLEVQEASGFLAGFAGTISTRRYIDSVMDDVTSELGVWFNQSVDTIAKTDEVSWQHVYESGRVYPGEGQSDTIGNPTQRLWFLNYTGRGGSRQVSFTFRPSTRPVPIHPLLAEPGKSGRHVLKNVHIFTWKAPIMEYGLSVSITPQLSPKKFLAFVNDEEGTLVFTKKTVTTVPGDMGDRGRTIGQFTGHFTMWWNNLAPGFYDTYIVPRLEKETFTQKDLDNGVAHKRRVTKKVLTEADRRMAFSRAESRAVSEWEGRAHTYIERAKERRLRSLGYAE